MNFGVFWIKNFISFQAEGGLDDRSSQDFYRGHCEDMGLGSEGWGNVVIEAKIEDR